jgi:hypothetical protein
MSHRRHRLSEWADLVGASLPESLDDDRTRDATDVGPAESERRRPN